MSKSAELALILSLVDEVSKTAKGIKGDLAAIGKESQKTQGFMEKAGKGLASLGTTAIIGGIGLATAAVSGLGAAMGKLAIDALPIQGVRDAFQGLTGDADAALAALREGSLGMVKDADLMRSYNQAAQLVGKTFADQLPSAMGYLSKVSASTGESMGFMVDSLVKGVGRLSPMILDNLGIQVSLSDATERAAQMFGVEADALTKTQVQAGMMDVVIEKLAENTASMPDVAGTAAQSWAALGVTFSNVKDGIGLALIPALQAVLTPISDLAQTYGPQFVALFEDRAVPVITLLAEALGKLFSGDIRGGLEALFGADRAQQIMDIAQAIGDFAQRVGAFVSDHSEAFKTALIAIGAVLAGAAIANGVIAIGGAIAALVNPVTLVIAAVGLLAAAWAENWGDIQGKTKAVIDWLSPFITGAIDGIRQFWADNGEQIMATLKGMWEWITNAFAVALAWITQAIKTALEFVRQFWADNGEQIMATVNAVLEWLRGAFSAALEFIQTLITTVLNAVRAFWETHGDQIIATVTNLWQTVTAAFQAAIGWLSGFIQSTVAAWQAWWEQYGGNVTAIFQAAWDIVKTIFETVIAVITAIFAAFRSAFQGDWYAFGQHLREIWNALWNGIWRILENIWTIISNYIQLVVGQIRDLWTRFGDDLKRIWHNLWASVWEGLQNAWSGMLNYLVRLPGLIISFFTNTDWGEIGRDIVQGIANGISSAVGVIKDAAKRAAQAALDAAKGFLGISSPSKRAAEMIGRPFVAGVGAGIDRGMGDLARDQLADLSAQMLAVQARQPTTGGRETAGIDYERLGAAVAAALRSVPTFQITANYRYQDERDLRDDLRLLQMLGAAT